MKLNAHFVCTLALGMMSAFAPALQDVPNVADLQAFTREARYMSLPGFLRWMHLQQHGRWISRDACGPRSPSQGAFVGPAPTGAE